MDMEQDFFAEHAFGRLALKKMAPTPADFRLYRAEWLGDKPNDRQVLKVTGGEFRRAKTGKNKGKLTILVNGTNKTVYLTSQEIAALKH